MRNGFKKQYRLAVENLLGPLPENCGLSEQSIARAERALEIQVPTALRDYYLSIGSLRELNDAHNRLLDPCDWFLESDKLAFMVENQAVLYWGVTISPSPEVNPPVFQAINQESWPLEWSLENESCLEFLLIMIHWQAVCGGLEWLGMTNIDQEIVDYLETNWHSVGRQDGIIAFRRDGQAACVIGDADCLELYVGTNSEDLFETITSELEDLGSGLDAL